jgi:nitrogen fixation protein NifU and related proteins
MSVYKERLKDHANNPRNYGPLENSDFCASDQNPSCGDRITISGRLDGDIVCELRFEARGCMVSVAAGSILTEECTGCSISDILVLTHDDAVRFLGVPLGPVRRQCCTIALDVLQNALKNK